MSSRYRGIWVLVLVLLAIQTVEFGYVVHRESLTFDEDNHMFDGYMMATPAITA